MIPRSSLRRPRAGFTMIELLVVISIIVLLVGLLTSAVMRFRLMAPKLATKSNLQNLKNALDTQLKAVRDKAQKENISTADQTVVRTAVGNSSLSMADATARTKYVQLKVIQAFPVSFDELMNPAANNLLPTYGAYKTYLSRNIPTLTSANAKVIASNEVQQAICLMMILQSGPGNSNSISPESLGSSGAKQLVLRNGATAWGCVDAYDARMESPFPAPANGLPLQNQPAGPLLFSRTFTGTNLTPSLALLSAGADQDYGIDLSFVPPVFPTNSASLTGPQSDNIQVPPLP